MSAPMTRLLLIRHGEAEGNRELRYLGATDAFLTSAGGVQAQALAEALRAVPLSAIYTSPLRRARATAEALAAGRDLALQVDERLREQSYGAWEGLTRAEALALDPRAHAEWERFAVDAPPDGEALAALRERSVACAADLAMRHEGEVVALVSHVGPIKALVCATLGLSVHGLRRMWLTPASVCVIDWPARGGEGAGILRMFNGGADLAALAPSSRP